MLVALKKNNQYSDGRLLQHAKRHFPGYSPIEYVDILQVFRHMRNAFIRLIYNLINIVFLFSTTTGNLSCSKHHERTAWLDLYTGDNKGAC